MFKGQRDSWRIVATICFADWNKKQLDSSTVRHVKQTADLLRWTKNSMTSKDDDINNRKWKWHCISRPVRYQFESAHQKKEIFDQIWCWLFMPRFLARYASTSFCWITNLSNSNCTKLPHASQIPEERTSTFLTFVTFGPLRSLKKNVKRNVLQRSYFTLCKWSKV